MMSYSIISHAILVVMLICAAVLDLRTRRIPNALTFTLIGCGLIASFLPFGLLTPAQAILGFFAGLAIPFILFAIGALGAGDVKLMAGIGASLGAKAAIAIFLAAMIVALALVIVQSAIEGKFFALLKNTVMLVLMVIHIRHLGATHINETGRGFRSVSKPLPYAVPILIATLILLLAPGLMGVS